VHQLAQHVGDAIEHRVVRGQALGVAREKRATSPASRRPPPTLM
jgi:hypothetical protein